MILGLVLAVVGLRPAGADEPLVPDAVSGTFAGSQGGFFVCTFTDTSPVDTPDCFLGYLVPDGRVGAGRLRAVGSGFQRSSNFTVLEEVSADPGALMIGDGMAAVDVTFPDLGRLQVRLVAGPRRPGWASSACPRTVLAYALAAGASTVFPVVQATGTLSRNGVSEDVALYGSPEPIGCFAYFTGPADGGWRLSQPHSAGHRRFELPPPLPSWRR
ncbi:MAG TPA: hypothetical protein VGR20_25070 [Acidimicrobiia bacterium]|nr:hypothetical protein [Acidimicrobiia bacterium]